MSTVPILVESKPRIAEMLSKYNDNDESETIQICANIIKINKRNKKQERLFVLTDKAIYNIKSQTIKRRIALSQIAAITKSSISTEFTLSIPSEYDYRFDAKHRALQNEIISRICQSIVNLQQEVLINTINASDTEAWTVTKTNLKQIDHYNETVRTVMALDHLNNMGFKSYLAMKTLKQNNGNLPCTIQALVGDYVDELEENKAAKSPFISACLAPLSAKVSPVSSPYTPATPNQLSPSLSLTQAIDSDDAFVL